jgi:peroxiredoxin
MRSVQRVHNDFKNKGVVTLIVSVDADGVKAVEPYMRQNGFSILSGLDSDLKVANAYGVLGTPTTFVVNNQDTIAAKGFGPLDFDKPEVRKFIQVLADQSSNKR